MQLSMLWIQPRHSLTNPTRSIHRSSSYPSSNNCANDNSPSKSEDNVRRREETFNDSGNHKALNCSSEYQVRLISATVRQPASFPNTGWPMVQKSPQKRATYVHVYAIQLLHLCVVPANRIRHYRMIQCQTLTGLFSLPLTTDSAITITGMRNNDLGYIVHE